MTDQRCGENGAIFYLLQSYSLLHLWCTTKNGAAKVSSSPPKRTGLIEDFMENDIKDGPVKKDVTRHSTWFHFNLLFESIFSHTVSRESYKSH